MPSKKKAATAAAKTDAQTKGADVGAFEGAQTEGADVGAFAPTAPETSAPEVVVRVPVVAKEGAPGVFTMTSEVVAFAARVGVELTAPIEERADLAASHMNRSQRHMLAAGLLLASIKVEAEHGEFLSLVQERGFEVRSAQKAMQYAHFIASRPHEERERLLEWPKSKVMELAGADPEVLDTLLLDGVEQVDTLSVRAMRERIAELTAQVTDTTVQRDTAEAELETARAQLAKRPGEREDKVPNVVADLRSEIVAQAKMADLALAAFNPLSQDLTTLWETDEAHDWADATARLAVSALGAIRLQLDGLLKRYLDMLPGGDPTASPRSHLTKQEVLEAAQRYAQLTAQADHEKSLREWERNQERPRGKGRPSARPEAPKGGR